MRALLRLILSLCCVLSIVYGQSLPIKREFRAAWIATVVNLDWPTTNSLSTADQQQQLISLLDQLKATGINAVIFQVRSECDAMYNSPYDPWSYWLTGTQGKAPSPYYDPLQFAVEVAHKRGIELHAWFNPYRVERSVGNYITASNHVSKLHPEWTITFNGSNPPIKILDPGIPDVRSYTARVMADVVRRYDIDGVHWDDYFYPYSPNSITNQDDASFAAYNPNNLSRADWRRDNVNKLVEMVHDSIEAIKPWVKFGISPFGIWKSGTPAGISGTSAYSELYCDAVTWMQNHYLDYLTPQLYWMITGPQDYSKLMPWWNSQMNGRFLYPGQAAYRIAGSNWSASELPNQIRLNRSTLSSPGSVFFRAGVGVLDNEKGFADSLKNNLYKYPALVPSMPWKDSLPPNAPLNASFGRSGNSPLAQIMWSVPAAATDNDSATMYVIYQTGNTVVSQGDIDDARNISTVTDQRSINPLLSSKSEKNFFITALDKNYNESQASAVVSLTTLPAKPVLAFPVSDSSVDSPSPLLAWSYASGSSAYVVRLASDSAFTSDTVTSGLLFDSTFTASNLEGQHFYFWKAEGVNPVGEGPYSDVGRFFTGYPLTPVLSDPGNFLTNVRADTLQLSWFRTDAATNYRFQISPSLDFNSLTVDSSGISDTVVTIHDLKLSTIYNWRVAAANAYGTGKWSAVFRFKTTSTALVFADGNVPDSYQLDQNFPNPFNPLTNIRFTIAGENKTILKVYNILGSEVATLVDETLPAGTYTVPFDGNGLASGVYIYRIISGKFAQTKKMILQK